MPIASHPILSQHFDSSEVAFAKIDKEVAALQESIRALYAFRNTFTPTYRVPPEILTRIFFFVREEEFYHYAPLRWIVISHISRHWRNVALSCPSLWSNITHCKHQSVAKEWLRRSKAAPLSVILPCVTLWDIKRVVGPSLSRIQELTLGLGFGSESPTWEDVSRHLSSPAPRLKQLFISYSNGMFTSGPRSSAPPTISDTLFAGTTPLLQRVKIYGCSADLNSSILTNLTTLTLQNPDRKLSSVDLLTGLQRLPHLTSLTFSDTLNPGASSVPPNVDVVTLSSLKTLSIGGESFSQTMTILAHLSFPIATNIHLTCHGETAAGNLIIALTYFMRIQTAARIQDASAPPPPRQVNFGLHCSCNLVRLSIVPQGKSLTYVLEVELYLRRAAILKLTDTPEVRSFLSLCPLQSTTSFKTDCDIDVGIWTQVFGSLPGLTELSFSSQYAFNALDAIVADFEATCPAAYGNTGRSTAGSSGRGRQGRGKSRGGHHQRPGSQVSASASQSEQQMEETWNPIFPNLKKFVVSTTYFEDRMPDFIAVLRARRAVDKGIKVLGFMRCWDVDEDDETLDEMRALVDEVIWEGPEDDVLDEPSDDD